MSDSTTASIGEEIVHRLQEAESQLAHLRRELEHGQRLATIGVLAASVAHEVNNLLTPVLSYAQLAKSSPDDHALQSKAIDKAITGAEAASRVLQAILGFAAPAENTSTADVQRTVDDTMSCLARDPSKDGIRLSTHIQPGLRIRMHPLSLQQVLLNLTLNACRVMRPKGGELKITAIERTDGTTLITVSDTGPGVPPEIAGRIFEPFVTSQSGVDSKGGQTGRERGGVGLGLAICRQLMESAGGSIAVSSGSARGATFTLIVPTAPRERAKTG